MKSRILIGRVLLTRRFIGAAAAMTVVALIGGGFATAQSTPPQKPPMAEQVFKNVRVLKGLTVDDFMETMGIICAGLAFDCSDCHTNAGTNKVDWAADTPRKVIARTMITMVQNINKNNFGGRQEVTCWTCHRNRDKPLVTPALEVMYGEPSLIPDDIIQKTPGLPSPDSILDKFIEASGGAQRLAGLTSIDAKGISTGFGGFGGDGAVEIAAKAPDKRATIVVFPPATGRGDEVRIYDGHRGFTRTPLNVLGGFELFGGDLDGARFDAELAFPGQIKRILTDLRTGDPTTISDIPVSQSQQAVQKEVTPVKSYDVNVVQGNGPRGLLVTLYFDKQTGLLDRELRYSDTPIGRVPTEIDFSDYRDVNGIKLPFRIAYVWLDGRDAIVLNDVKTNVPIDDSKFALPASTAKP